MSLHGIERRQRKIVAAEEVGVVAEEGPAGSELERPGPTDEIPSSGLNDQRLLPRLSSLLLSCCPNGAET